MAWLHLLLTSLSALIAAIFAAQNPIPVELRFMRLASVPLPLGLVVIMAASLGALSVMILTFWVKPAFLKPSKLSTYSTLTRPNLKTLAS